MGLSDNSGLLCGVSKSNFDCDIVIDGQNIYWTEVRPQEKGRTVIMRSTPDGALTDVTPAGYDVRSKVHEYGGVALRSL